MTHLNVFDYRVRRLKKAKTGQTIDQAIFLAQEIETVLWQRLDHLQRQFSSVLVLGCPAKYLTSQIIKTYPRVICAEGPDESLSLERESLPFQNNSFDLVLDGFGLHWVNHIPQALLEVRRILSPGGLYLSGFLGENTLKELRQILIKTDLSFFSGAYARVSPFLKLQTISDLLMAVGFQNPIVDHEELEVHYPSLHALITDLRNMGETNCLIREHIPFKRDYFRKANDLYLDLFATPQEKIKATFDCVYLIAENNQILKK